MDYLDPQFDAWLVEHETEANRVKRSADWRERQARELLVNVNLARVLMNRARNDGSEIDASEMGSLVEKIKELRSKIGK